MYDYRRLSSGSLYENPLNSVFRTPTEKEIVRLEDSNKQLIEKWRQYKNELEDEIVEFRNHKICWSFIMFFTCFIAVEQCIGLNESFKAAFCVLYFMFLFRMLYFDWRRLKMKLEMKASNEDIENGEEIKEVIFNLEKSGNEKYLVFYKEQLKQFNDAKSKEVSILKEEIRMIDNQKYLWERNATGISLLFVWIALIHSVIIAVVRGANGREVELMIPTLLITYISILRWPSKPKSSQTGERVVIVC
ncbi:hypothetical protein GCK72_017146 [Caenorhabditis remanei]|uniref:Uncharacterized protein n=1 Tax=Caenorhabditis remanei TaxID=31234 RepID=A0A6A5G7F4_CAERE|nr:hypothetical protein GCK72_017146 [Caenorhabditis remanei]KAF1750595.1 hypothetical protein GCK72_017146 [Caenorhabditis remanei]